MSGDVTPLAVGVDEVEVEGSVFRYSDLPEILGNHMRASDQHMRDAKAAASQADHLRDVLDLVSKRRDGWRQHAHDEFARAEDYRAKWLVSEAQSRRLRAEREELLVAINQALDFESVLPAIATVPRRILTDALTSLAEKQADQ